MLLAGMANVPGAPGNQVFTMDYRPERDGKPIISTLPADPNQPGTAQILPFNFSPSFGSSNLPAAVGNMAGLANATFFEGPQLGQAAPEGVPAQPYGGAPNRQLTEEEKQKLMQQGTPPPANFREQFFPQAGVVAGFKKYVS